MKTARSFRHPLIAIIWAALHVVPLTGEVVPIGGGGNPHYPEAPVPAADMARLKKYPPFRGMTDANVQEKIVRIRLNLLDSIAVVRAENPAIADCLQKQFDANRIYIDFANSHASGSIVHDRLPECNAEAITIGVAKLPCDRLPAYDLQMAELTGTLLHEGLHGIQDWRPTPDAPQPPVTDVDQAKKWEAYHCREKEASDLEEQLACELIEVLDEVAAGNPIPPTARGRAKAIGESITGDAQLTADQKKAAAARLLADTKLLKEGYHLIAACREQIKNAYRDFINGTLSKPQLNRTLSINGWFLHYGGVGGFGPKIAYMGDGNSRQLRQIGNGARQEFAIAGLDRIFAMELLPGGTKAIFIGDELESGDGIVLGYRDTNGDGFLEEGTREELFRTNDLAHGVHLARNPANGDLMALNRSNNTLLRLNDLNSDLFPDSTEILGEFDPLAEDALYLSFSTDGKTAYANEAFDPRMGGVILPKESWAVAEASVPGGGYIQASTVDPLRIGTIGPAFEAEPLAGQYFIWANGMPATDLEVHRIVGGELQLLGQARTNADGRTIIVLETPLIAGHQLQLRDPMRTLQSAVQTVMAIQLNIVRENGDIWLRWPGRAVHLQSATSLTAPFSMVGQAVSPYRLGNPTGTLFFRLTSLFGLAGLPIQDPCPGGTLLVRQAYSECQDDGFWHVVEDNWYACPGEKEPVRYRVADQKTEQRCTEGMEPPNASAVAPPKVDATCQSPVDTGLKFVLMVCTNGHWAEDTYRIVRCLDGSLRLDGPISNVPAQPPTRCSARPPRPQPPSP